MRRVCGRHTWTRADSLDGRCTECALPSVEACAERGCVATRCRLCAEDEMLGRVHTVDIKAMARRLERALARQLDAHGHPLPADVVRAVASNLVYAVTEATR